MYLLYVAKPSGFSLEAPNIGSQLLRLGHEIGFHNGRAPKDEQIQLMADDFCRHRIHIARNLAVAAARQYGATHLMMIDPDMCIDWYVGRTSWAKPWWKTYWPRAKTELGVFAVPYAGMLNPPLVQVFDADGPTKTARVSSEDAAARRGWQKVQAAGTGLLLIPMEVFDRIDAACPETPYFSDREKDWRKTELEMSQDLWFCERCRDAGVPIWVNWDCWAGHWQNQVVEGPRREDRPCVAPELLQATQEVVAPWA